jgi:hypothetical protein
MSKEVDAKAAELLALAIQHNRQEYIDALSFLIPVRQLAEALAKDPKGFDDSWKKKLLRNNYSPEDVTALSSVEFLKNTDYLDFVVEMTASANNLDAKYGFIKYLLENCKYEHASLCYQALEDKAAFADVFKNRVTRFQSLKASSYFYRTGDVVGFNRTAAKLFDAIGLDVPADFDGDYGDNHRRQKWSEGRFDAAVDWVSDIVETNDLASPAIERQADGSLAIVNSTVIQAFIDERTRIQSKALGAWHESHFPRYAPVLASPELANELQAKGLIMVEPDFGDLQRDGADYQKADTLSHAFKAVNDPTLDRNEISLSMSFLPHDVITQLRDAPENTKVFLVPHDTSLNLKISPAVSDELRIAMRYHRPEFFKNRVWSAIYDFESAGLGTRAYLRGMDVLYDSSHRLKIENEMMNDSRFVRALNSTVEREYLKHIFTPSKEHEAKRVRLVQKVGAGPVKDQVDKLIKDLNVIVDKLGFFPGVTFSGSEEFIRMFADDHNLPMTECNKCHYWDKDKPGSWTGNETPEQSRLSARLGAILDRKFVMLPVEELLAKAPRLKAQSDILRTCGILDRLGVVGVANLARTPAQRVFVVEHFDVKSHLKELPAAMRKMITGPMLEEALGL